VRSSLSIGGALAAREGRYSSALRLLGGSRARARNSDSQVPEPFGQPVRGLFRHAANQVGRADAKQLIEDGKQMSWDVLAAEALTEPDEHDGFAGGSSRDDRRQNQQLADKASPSSRADCGQASEPTILAAVNTASRTLTGMDQQHTDPSPPSVGRFEFHRWLGELSTEVVSSLLVAGTLALISVLWALLR
jgi:hypothetical protein